MILFAILQRLFSVLSFAVVAAGAWLLWRWYDVEHLAETLGLPEPSDAPLWWAVGLLAFAVVGRPALLLVLGRAGSAPPVPEGRRQRVTGADGALLNVEQLGTGQGPILLFTHGWGMNHAIWREAARDLSARFDLVLWDLPGSGRSGRPPAGYSVEGFAEDLHAVIDSLPAERQVVLVGHSIGGMTTLTLCARRPELLNRRVIGIVLENTTHTNPLRTMLFAPLFTALRPLIALGCKVEAALSPISWVGNWLAWMNGTTHLAMRLVGFGSQPTREQLDRAVRLPTMTSPAVQARGTLAMLRWSVTERMPAIDVPALVFVGGRDIVTKDHAGETIADTLPQAKLVRVEDAGHMGPIEKAEVYNEQIGDFVDFVSLLASRPAAGANRSFLAPEADLAPRAGIDDQRIESDPPQMPLRPRPA